LLLALDDVGRGPAVVLLHAGVADRRMWAEHMEAIATAGYRAVAMDLPQFGESETSAKLASTELAPWADVVETLDALAIEQAVLVGNSFGGAVALRVAVTAPTRVLALALFSAGDPALEPSTELSAAWAAEESALERGDLDGAVRAVVDAWTLPGSPRELRSLVGSMQRRAFDLQAAEPLPEAPDPLDVDPAALGSINVPVLVAAGELDMPDFREAARRLSAQLPRARGELIPDAGHLAPLEVPDRFRALLLGFLEEIIPPWPTTKT
jgi:pimeloyl-ACP methyl ester carboxylesterase